MKVNKMEAINDLNKVERIVYGCFIKKFDKYNFELVRTTHTFFLDETEKKTEKVIGFYQKIEHILKAFMNERINQGFKDGEEVTISGLMDLVNQIREEIKEISIIKA